MRRESSRAAASSELRSKEKASRAPAGGKKSELNAGSEPALLGERDVGCRDEVESVERGHKRQATQTPATTRRCPVRQSPRSLALLAKPASGPSSAAEECSADAAVNNSLLLNKMPTELLENVLSCESFPIALFLCNLLRVRPKKSRGPLLTSKTHRSCTWTAGLQLKVLWGGREEWRNLAA